jgi:MFS family permease
MEVRCLYRSVKIPADHSMYSAYVSSSGEWIARCLVMGFMVAPIEALPEISVTDIYFTHQRGTYMGIYSFALAGSNYFAPIICGFIAERQGWQWVFYWPAIFNAFTFIFLFFFMEETNYQRQSTGVASTPGSPPVGLVEALGDQEKPYPVTSRDVASIQAGTATKTFSQKLSVWQPMSGQSMFQRAKRSLQLRLLLDPLQHSQRNCLYHPWWSAVQLQFFHGRLIVHIMCDRSSCWVAYIWSPE